MAERILRVSLRVERSPAEALAAPMLRPAYSCSYLGDGPSAPVLHALIYDNDLLIYDNDLFK